MGLYQVQVAKGRGVIMTEQELRDDQFQCAMCYDIFDKERSDEEALIECRSYFGELPIEELAVVCSKCWEKIHPERN